MSKKFRVTLELEMVSDQKLQDILVLFENLKYNGNFSYPVANLEVVSSEMLRN